MNTPQNIHGITIEEIFVPRKDGSRCPAGFIARLIDDKEQCCFGLTAESAKQNLHERLAIDWTN